MFIFSLISLTLMTSLVDSLNPFAIAQQFTLQGLLKRKSDIWYYIMTIFSVNYLAGVLYYLSMSTLSKHFLAEYWSALKTPAALAALVIGLGLIWYSIHSVLRNWKARKIFARQAEEMTAELKSEYSKKALSPSSLIGIGLSTTMIEFTTAAPFVAYLTLLHQFQPTLWEFAALLFLYVFIFTLPLIILYFLYLGFQSTFERIYRKLTVLLQIVSAFLLPVLFVMIALLLIGFSIGILMLY